MKKRVLTTGHAEIRVEHRDAGGIWLEVHRNGTMTELELDRPNADRLIQAIRDTWKWGETVPEMPEEDVAILDIYTREHGHQTIRVNLMPGRTIDSEEVRERDEDIRGAYLLPPRAVTPLALRVTFPVRPDPRTGHAYTIYTEQS